MNKIAIIGFLFFSFLMITGCGSQTNNVYASSNYQNEQVNTFNTIHRVENHSKLCTGTDCLEQQYANTPREIELNPNVNEKFRCEGCREEINILDKNEYRDFQIIEAESYNPKTSYVKTKYCTNNYGCPIQTINSERGRYSCINEVCKPCNFQSDCTGEYNYCSTSGLCTKQWD